jgi:hypothetical protein
MEAQGDVPYLRRRMTGRLTASFTRRRGELDLVQVTRSDGTRTEWEFPTYGDALPHDLVHFVVERGLELTGGFWGLVDDGADVVAANGQAVLCRHGEPLREPTVDFSGLVQAEEAVALLGPQPALESAGGLMVARLDPGRFSPPGTGEVISGTGFRLPEGATADRVTAIQRELSELTRRWCQLDHEADTLSWHR